MGQTSIAHDSLVETEKNPKESWGRNCYAKHKILYMHVCGEGEESWGYTLTGNSSSSNVRIFRKKVYKRKV